MADKFEKFAELIEERQKDTDEAFETLREIGESLQSTGRRIGDPLVQVLNVRVPDGHGGWKSVPPVDYVTPPPAPDAPPIHQPSPEEVADLAVAILNFQSESPDQEVGEAPAEPDEQSDDGLPLPKWLLWVIAVGGVLWGITRKKT